MSQKGHYNAQCRTKPISEVSSEMILEEAFLDTISNCQMSSWFANISVLSRTIQFKLDTGAKVTAISQKTYNNLPLKKASRVLGQFEMTIGHKEKSTTQIIFLIKGLKNNCWAYQQLSLLVWCQRMTP